MKIIKREGWPEKKERRGDLLFWWGTGLFLFLLSGTALFFRGPLGEKLLSRETLGMLSELLFLLLFMELSLFLGRRRGSLLLALSVSVYLWMHAILAAICIALLFIVFLTILGELLLLPLHRREGLGAPEGILRCAHSFVFGSGTYILSLCLLSFFGLGEMSLLHIYTMCMLSAAGLLLLYLYRDGLMPVPRRGPRNKETKRETFWHNQCLAGAFWLLLLQAGRINIALDYDSLRYAFRTPFVLNAGKGIYENLGMVNTVYMYPKGLEVLTMPLNLFGSYSLIAAFSWCMSFFLAALVYGEIARRAGRMRGAAAALLLCLIPGIMNLGISGKTDMMTLFIQVTAVFSMLCMTQEESLSQGLRSVFALGMSLIYKPTSFFFSGLLFFPWAFYFPGLMKSFIKKKKLSRPFSFFVKEAAGRGGLLLLPMVVNGLIHYRTWLFTGQPLGSVFGGLWEALGMEIRYPFKVQSIPSREEGAGLWEGAVFLVRRLAGLFVLPVGEEFHHILIAAPGILLTVLLLWQGWLFLTARREKKPLREIDVMLIFVAFGSLYALHGLYQVDGNYFILLYSLIVIAFFLGMESLRGIWKPLLLPGLFSLFLLCVTNWAGVTGLTPVSFRHFGYYSHESMFAGRMEAMGMGGVRRFLQSRGKVRLLSMTSHPEGLLFPVISQSYTDVTGSGGNVVLVKSLANFEEFLAYAKIDYIYADGSFLADHARAEEIIRFMLEEKSLLPVLEEEGHALYQYIPADSCETNR